MKIKVAHIISSLNLGGVEKAIQLSTIELNSNFEYKVFTLSNNNKINIDAKHLNSGKYKYILFSFFKSTIALHKYKPDIIVTSLWRSVLFSYTYKKIFNKRVVLVSFIHSETFFHFLDKFFIKLMAKNADAIAFDSINTALAQRNIAKADTPSYVIPYVFLHNYGLVKEISNTNVVKFVFAGRIVPIKNLESSLLFFKHLSARSVDFVFDIYGIGEDAYINNLKLITNSYNISKSVTFKGQFDANTAVGIFNSYHFYIQFSINEGMAMSVVDAMLCGLIPIVTPVGEIKNYVLENFNGLILYDKDGLPEYEKLIDKLFIVMNDYDLFANFSTNALNYFKTHKSYIAAFKEMILNLKSKRSN